MTVEIKSQNLLNTVLTEIHARRYEFEEKRHVPGDMIDQFKQLGIYRAHAPRCFGGDACSLSEFLRVIETISEADGSAGWVASFGSAAVYLAALPREMLARL